MDTTTYAILLKKIKDSQGANATQEQVQAAVNDYLTKNPVKITETDPTVPEWAKNPTKPTYTASEVGALADTTVIPSKLSEMAEDTTHRVVSDVEKQKWNGKAEKSDIPDVATIMADHDKSPTSHDDIRQDLTLVKQNLKEFVKSDQGIANKDKILGIGADGMVVPTDKPTIPTQLPNPHKLTFQGAVTAEYDGSGAVTVTIPSGSSGGSVEVERIEKFATDTTVELVENKLYIFPEMASLTYTLKAPTKPNVANEYHFVFKSGASATQLVHAVGVNVGTFKVEPNKIYEVSIMENLLTSQSWAVV